MTNCILTLKDQSDKTKNILLIMCFENLFKYKERSTVSTEDCNYSIGIIEELFKNNT